MNKCHKISHDLLIMIGGGNYNKHEFLIRFTLIIDT